MNPKRLLGYAHRRHFRHHIVRILCAPICWYLPKRWRYRCLVFLGHALAWPIAQLSRKEYGALRYRFSSILLWACGAGGVKIPAPVREYGFSRVDELLQRYGKLILLSVHARFNVGARVLLDRAGHRTLGLQTRPETRTWATDSMHEICDVRDPRSLFRARRYLESGGIVTCLIDTDLSSLSRARTWKLPLSGVGQVSTGMFRFARLTKSPILIYAAKLAPNWDLEVHFSQRIDPPQSVADEVAAMKTCTDFLVDLMQSSRDPEFVPVVSKNPDLS